MKFLKRDDLQILIDEKKVDPNLTPEAASKLVEEYGDDWYRGHGSCDGWKLTTKNEKMKKLRNSVVKPPLGVVPRNLVKLETIPDIYLRIKEIKDAIIRYREAELKVSDIWHLELGDLEKIVSILNKEYGNNEQED